MSFGQYSPNGQPALSKRAMVANVLASRPGAIDKAAKVARNTLDYISDGVRRVRLHQTDIITFRKRGGFTIDTGGWNTHTTRARLNDHLPGGWYVYTLRGVLHLGKRGAAESWQFQRTVAVTSKGTVRADIKPAALAKLQKQIDSYLAAWRKRGLPSVEESGGDPWLIADGRKVERAVMLDWLKSKYVHRRLYIMALRYAGLTDQGAYYFCQMADRRNGELDKTDLRRIRRYVRACLGLES